MARILTITLNPALDLTVRLRQLELGAVNRSEAVLTSMLVGIVVCACAPLWAFATASVLRAWVGIGVPAVAMFAAAAWLQRGAA